MKLAHVDDPLRYQDLYVFDFGDWTAVGYTAAEVAMLLDSERYREGKVYRIHAAAPDGRFELQGVDASRFQLEGGMFFYRGELGAAREDFDALVAAAESHPLPCRAYLQLADRGSQASPESRYGVALIFPAEYERPIGRWLLERAYAGGTLAEGGVSHVTNYLEESKHIVARRQFFGREAIPSRSADEVYASVRQAVQR